tara:strand:+ start:5718 stop:7442 length:1725 start_codon:yes stop_codon:yes gene_type:complete
MRKVILDIETDGLKPKKVWVVVLKDVVTNEVSILRNPTHDSLKEFMGDVTHIVGHNVIAYDLRVLHKLLGFDSTATRVTDTLVLSRLYNPSLEGGHSLREWGLRLKLYKGDYSDWSELTEEMITYCVQDVEVTHMVLNWLTMKLAPFGDESIEMEHSVQEVIATQIENGWLLDQKQAIDLLGTLYEKKLELETRVRDTFKPLPVFIKEIVPKYKKDGVLSIVGLKFLGDSHDLVSGSFSRIDYPDFNLGSRQQIGKYLQWFGWKPKDFTEHGQPIVDEKVLSSVKDIPEAQLIGEYLLVQKRIAQVESWVDAVADDGRVHGYVNSIGAVTGRMTHSSPNMAQVPAGYSPYGKECRSCWVVPKGYKLVGCDAAGLELRMLSHYMDDVEYTKEILHGDIHTANQTAAGLATRDQAKTFIYAFLYGAGDAKIGTITGGSARDGRRLKTQFLTNTPALANLRDRVGTAANRGYLTGLDGRKLWIRSPHAALNTLLQSAGAIVMKKALTLLEEYAKLYNIQYKFVGNIHDEIQAEVREDQAKTFGWLAVECIKAAGVKLNLRCPLDGDFKIGESWEQTH